MKLRVAAVCLLALLMANQSPADDSPLWSFRPPVRPTVPNVKRLRDASQVVNAIDAFVMHRLEAMKLSAAPRADRRTLVRRAYFDLLGLPPTPEQVDAFVKDKSADAWPRLIDTLLESKHYGERWGRHWLDVARYADSGGYETDIYLRNAWRYRDYVIKSFNDDKPYNIFVQEQVAGDEIWPDNLDLDPKRVYIVSDKKKRHLEALTGTGFYSLGPIVHESGLDAQKLRHEQLTDWADTTAAVFMGITMGCARCHEHKFDPLTHHDYYAFQAIFARSIEKERPLLTAMEMADWKQHYPRILAVDEARRAYRLYERQTSGRKRTKTEQEELQRRLENIAHTVLQLPEQAGSVPRSPFAGLMDIPRISVLGHERPELAKPVRLLDRGELRRAKGKVTAALPAALAKTSGAKPSLAPLHSRKQLALWLTSGQHPLTARVMVNRLWQWHFGRGIVATPNDFGNMGSGPSHPKLLDWLATEFVRQKWSIKQMHRLIMLSNAYKRSSKFGPVKNLQEDPSNRYLWRMNRRRLEAETLWDAVHTTSGQLNLKMGGRPVVPALAEDEIAALREKWHWPVSADPAEHRRRGLYILVRRNFRFPMFEVFDAPITSVSCPQRDVTTVAPQALWGLNNRSVFRQAEAMADRIIKTAGNDTAKGIQQAWQIALSRPPSAVEMKEATELLKSFSNPKPNYKMALAKLCLALFNVNEFSFVD